MKRYKIIGLSVAASLGLVCWATKFGQAGTAKIIRRTTGTVSYFRLPLSFEKNEGQAPSLVKYLARGQGFTVFLTRGEAVLQLAKFETADQKATTPGPNFSSLRANMSLLSKDDSVGQFNLPRHSSSKSADIVSLKLLGANPHAKLTGDEQLQGYTSYFLGSDPRNWHTHIPNFARVSLHEVYPGIDLIYYGHEGQLENDFVVSPASDPKRIRLALKGAEDVHVKPSGDLALRVSGGEICLRQPRAYQEKDGHSKEVDVHYVLQAGNKVTFALGDYDPSRPLVIDPVLTYSTYLGGSGGDAGRGIAVDASGNVYVTGQTASLNFPTTSSGVQTANGGGTDVFVTKLNSTGTAFVYSVYLGGNDNDFGTGIALDSSGDAYITGYTSSANFPTTSGAYKTSYAGNTDAFLTKLDPSGATLIYSTYLGGGGIDYGRAVAVDPAGDAFVTGFTQSGDFPTMNPLQGSFGGVSDAFVTEFNPGGTALLYSTYLGGSGADEGLAIALDGSGNPYIAGYTLSSDFPVRNALQATLAGPSDAFVAEINPGTSSLVFSTYLGGSGAERAQSIALDSTGNIYLAGITSSSDFPVTSGAAQGTAGGMDDAFVVKLSPGAAQVLYATYLGGSGEDQGQAIAVDSSGDAFVTGLTQSSNFPLADALQSTLGITGADTCGSAPCADVFLTEFGPSGTLTNSTFLGGSDSDFGNAIAVDSGGAVYVTGGTASGNFPVIAGAPQSTYAGASSSTNAFIAKISPQDAPAVAFTPQSLAFGNQDVNFASSPKSVTLVNEGSAPLSITSVSASGPFSETDNCSTGVAAGGGTCTIQVTFTPTQTGSATGQINVTDNAQGSPQSISLSGTGVTATGAVTLSPTSLTFDALTVGQTSTSQTVQIQNTGNIAVNISNITVSGDFAQTNDCGTLPVALNPGQSCNVNVTFAPTSSGSLKGTLNVTDDASGSPQTVSLSGTGNAVFSLSANQTSNVLLIGTQSTTFTVTAAAPSSFTSTIDLSCTAGTCTFSPSSIAPGQTSTLTVSGLSPSTANPFNFDVKGTSGSQSATVSLAVLFSDFSLSASPPLVTVPAGQSATYNVTVNSSNGFNQEVLLSCSNLPQQTSCSFSPSSLTLDGTNPGTSTLTIKTTGPSASYSVPRPPGPSMFGWWTILAALCTVLSASALFFGRRTPGAVPYRLRTVFAVLLLLVSLSALVASCNDYYYGPNTTPVTSGTPPNTYTITLVGTMQSNNSIQRTTTVNLSVSP
ncbi:MAG TPA: SBBP repeat-containing protein [Terriglobia bacterium]|nr:SBBP repeat-containing protein [Terriglobia bacterium]